MSEVKGKFLGDVTNKEVPSGTINGVNDTFTLAFVPTSNDSLNLTLDGLTLILSTDYTVSTLTITMTVPPAVGQVLYATYQYRSN